MVPHAYVRCQVEVVVVAFVVDVEVVVVAFVVGVKLNYD
jgi:hypothetical protein